MRRHLRRAIRWLMARIDDMSDEFGLRDEIDARAAAERELRDKYQALFGHGVGREVLADILKMCHFGENLDPNNPAQVAAYNVGMEILQKCKVLQEDNYLQIVSSMLGLP